MSEYKRFVSYIYAYTKEGKGNNAGFAKVEIRAGKKRISITMRGISNIPMMHVCGFCRKEERLVCVPLGRMILTGGMGQFQYGMDGEWIPGSRVRFEELAGIVISASDSSGETYATVWDDEPFQLSMFACEEEKLEEKEPEEESSEKEGLKKESEQEPTIIKSLEEEKIGESMEEEEEAVMENQECHQYMEQDPENSVQESEVEPTIIKSLEEEKIGESMEEEEEAVMENQECHQYMEQDPENSVQESEVLHSAQFQEEQENEEEDSEFWKKMCRIYPKITPFSYENHMECLKVKPGDIGRLPRQNWIFGNNSFLLHGYFKYRYLIFGRVKEEESGGYLIGVPGTYSSNEKFLAGMFGFYDFKPVQKGSTATGTFGYWCTPMECPKNF